MIGRVFGIPPMSGGFAELLFERAEPEDVLIAAPAYGDRLRLLLAGSERPLDLLERRRIQAMLDRLRREADVIVVDSPALTEFADAIALADAVDTVLVAVRLGHSRATGWPRSSAALRSTASSRPASSSRAGAGPAARA
jgi:Mrp family chromosome partitioning ATPase